MFLSFYCEVLILTTAMETVDHNLEVLFFYRLRAFNALVVPVTRSVTYVN